jgi:alkaline phosphatase D
VIAMRETVSVRSFVLPGVVLSLCLGCAPAHLSGLPRGSPFHASPAESVRLTHGVAVGDVRDRSALVWFRTDGPARARVEWESEDGASQAGASPVVTTSIERDWTASVALRGLEPGTRYRYRVRTGLSGDGAMEREAGVAGSGRFVTAASPDRSASLSFIWSGDLGGQQRCRHAQTGYEIFDRMAKVEPAFMLFLGDTIYADDRCPSPPNAPGGDFLATTLDDYRAKHRYQREDVPLRRFLTSVPVYVMWDDHEVKNNFSGPFEPQMPAGRRALLDYWPIDVPEQDPTRLYRSFRQGADVELFLLDTRQYRSSNSEPDGEHKTLLGPIQRAWLLDGLKRSTATWKLVATSVPLAHPSKSSAAIPGNDSWARAADGTGFQTERDEILRFILTHDIRNVVWLAGDVHYAQVNEYDPDGDGTPEFREFICGPLSAASVLPVPPEPTFRPTTLYSEGGFMNFGLVSVSGEQLRLRIVDQAGTFRFDRTFPVQP